MRAQCNTAAALSYCDLFKITTTSASLFYLAYSTPYRRRRPARLRLHLEPPRHITQSSTELLSNHSKAGFRHRQPLPPATRASDAPSPIHPLHRHQQRSTTKSFTLHSHSPHPLKSTHTKSTRNSRMSVNYGADIRLELHVIEGASHDTTSDIPYAPGAPLGVTI